MKKSNVIVVDGANVAYIDKTEDGKPSVTNIVVVYRELEKKGYEPIIIVDASVKYSVDDQRKLEQLIQKERIRQAPAGTDADYFIIKLAKDFNAQIVTNDKYSPYKRSYPWVEDKRVPLMIVDGVVEFYHLKPVAESEQLHI